VHGRRSHTLFRFAAILAPLCLLAPLLLGVAWRAQDAAQPIAPGVTYERRVIPEGPWVIDIVRVLRATGEVALRPTLALGQVLGRATIAEQLPPSTETSRPVAAVNGDFFVMTGEEAGLPIGAHVAGHVLIRSGHDSPTVAFGPGGQVAICSVGFSGKVHRDDGAERVLDGLNQAVPAGGLVLFSPDYGLRSHSVDGLSVVVRADEGMLPLDLDDEIAGTVELVVDGPADIPRDGLVVAGAGSAADFLRAFSPGRRVRVAVASPGLPGWARGAVSGGPILVRHGAVVGADEVRHPRTAIGFNDGQIVLVTVDGRQPGWSVGMTLTELANLMLSLGCTEAMSLDGGGSTTMWVRGEVKNRPSDGSPRPVANGLAVVLNGPVGPPARALVSPATVWALPGAVVHLRLELTDSACNPLPADGFAVSASCAGGVAAAGDPLSFALGAPGTGEITLRVGDVTSTVAVHVVARPSAARIDPPAMLAMPGDAIKPLVMLLGPNGEALTAPAGLCPTFRCDPALASVTAGGELVVAHEASSGAFTAEALGVSTQARLSVAQARIVSACDELGSVKATVYPEGGATATVAVTGDRPASGTGCLALAFALGEAEATRAAYARFDAEVGRAIGFTAALRAEGDAPWVRLAYRDGNGTRTTLTLADRVDWANEWRVARVRLPDGTKPPVTLESIYVVETDATRRPKGTLFIDDVTAWVVEGQ